MVAEALDTHRSTGRWPAVDGLTRSETDVVAGWDDTIGLLEAEAAERGGTPLPETLSATMLVAAARDPQAFARQLLRPRPRPVSEAAVLGTRFHAWVERHYGLGQLTDRLVDLDDEGVESDERLAALQEGFLASPWAHRTPLAVEVPFTLVLGGQVVRGQIDAAFPADDGVHEHLLVDWKTSERPADDLQLAVYREAWALAKGIDPQKVDAIFVHVASGTVQRPARLATRAELEEALSSGLGAVSGMAGGRVG